MSARRAAVTVAIAVASLGIAACGDDSDETAATGTSSGAASTTAGEQPTGTPVKIMVTAAIDTQLQNASGVNAAVQAAAMAINDDGGINGQPVETVFCNNQSDPNKTAACARQAVKEKVTAVIPLATTTSTELYPPLEAAGIPVVGALPSVPADWESEVAYPVVSGAQLQNMAAGPQMAAHGLDSVATVAIDIAAAKPGVDAVTQGAEAAGLSYAGTVYWPVTTTDFAPTVRQLEELGAGGAMVIGTDEGTVSLVQAGNQLGVETAWAQTSQSVDEKTMLPPLGPLADGLMLPSGLPPLSAAGEYPGLQRFLDEMKAAEDAGVEGADETRFWSQAAWLAMHAIDIVGDEAGEEIDNATLIKAMDSAEDVDLFGLIEWSPGRPGPAAYPRMSNGRIYFAIAQDGEFVLDPELPEPVDLYEELGIE